MKFFMIIFATIVIQVQCRSITLSNMKDKDVLRSTRVHRDAKQDVSEPTWIEINVPGDFLNLTHDKISLNISEQLKNLVISYEEHFVKLIEFAIKLSKNKDNNKQQIQFLNQLGALIEQIIEEQSKGRNVFINLNDVTESILTNSKSIINVNDLKDLMNTIQDINIIYQDDNTDEHIRIKRATEERKEATSFITLEERITNILINIQRHLMQNRKYLEQLCKKHSKSTVTSKLSTDIPSIN